MADGDRAAPGVQLVHIDAQLLLAGQGLSPEGLIDLNLIDVGQVDAGLSEQSPDSRGRADAHDARVATGQAVADDPEKRGFRSSKPDHCRGDISRCRRRTTVFADAQS